MSENSTSPRRRPKGDKRERTRAKLLEAARDLVREQGYARTTVDDIAHRAGMSSGAVYGNFQNRDAVFLALGQAYWIPVKPKIRPEASFAELMQAMAEATIEALPERRLAVVGRLTGMAYGMGQEALLMEVSMATEASYEAGATRLRGLADADALPLPAEALVVMIHALTEGLVFQRLMTPDLVPDEVIRAAFACLAGVGSPR